MYKLYICLILLSVSFNCFAESNFVKELSKGNPQTLVVYGTSIESMEPNGRLWVRKIGEDLNVRYNNLLTLYNSGKSGQNSLWGLENLNDSVISRKPNALLIELATNDAVFDKSGLTPSDCRTNTLLMIDRVLEKFPDCEIFLHSPCGYPIGDNLTSRPNMWDYNNVYRDICLERGYIWINTANFFKSVAEDTRLGETVLVAYQGDGVHSTEKGALEILYPSVLKAMLTGETQIVGQSDSRYGIIMRMTPDYITQSATTDMSAHGYPYNWAAATGQLWTSSNVFAQYFNSASASAYLGKCIRFGKTDTSVGTATTPLMDLSTNPNEELTLKISIASGTNKSGILNVYLDNSVVPFLIINAKASNNGSSFSSTYYTFQSQLPNGTTASQIRFEQTKTENGGNLYLNSIEIERKIKTATEGINVKHQNFIYSVKDQNTLCFNQPVKATIFRTDGKPQIINSAYKNQIDISQLAKGFYLLSALTQDNETVSTKIVTQ